MQSLHNDQVTSLTLGHVSIIYSLRKVYSLLGPRFGHVVFLCVATVKKHCKREKIEYKPGIHGAARWSSEQV